MGSDDGGTPKPMTQEQEDALREAFSRRSDELIGMLGEFDTTGIIYQSGDQDLLMIVRSPIIGENGDKLYEHLERVISFLNGSEGHDMLFNPSEGPPN